VQAVETYVRTPAASALELTNVHCTPFDKWFGFSADLRLKAARSTSLHGGAAPSRDSQPGGATVLRLESAGRKEAAGA
jgi:hypothetical protein